MKTIDVDWDDPSDLKKKISQLQDRRKSILRKLGYDQIYFNGSKYNLSSILPAFNKMYETDFSHLFEGADASDFYVYAHCNPLKPLQVSNNIKHLFLASKFPTLKFEPFYIGKGTGKRFANLSRNDSHRKIRTNIRKFNKDAEPVILVDNVTEKTALSVESVLMDILGLRSLSNHGMLCNLDEGLDFPRHPIYNDDMITRIMKRNGFKI